VLDTLPGEVRAGGSDRTDHPADLIATLQSMGPTVPNRSHVQDQLMAKGEPGEPWAAVARWERHPCAWQPTTTPHLPSKRLPAHASAAGSAAQRRRPTLLGRRPPPVLAQASRRA